MIISITYDDTFQGLYIYYGGAMDVYTGVPKKVYEELKARPDKQAFIKANLVGKYEYFKKT